MFFLVGERAVDWHGAELSSTAGNDSVNEDGTEVKMSVDWSKPIWMENGRPLRLLGTNSTQFGPECPYVVERIDEDNAQCRIWWYGEDGKAHQPGMSVTNAPPQHRGLAREKPGNASDLTRI